MTADSRKAGAGPAHKMWALVILGSCLKHSMMGTAALQLQGSKPHKSIARVCDASAVHLCRVLLAIHGGVVSVKSSFFAG
jgi:hypothetical protein